jgi:hypothetical protein
VIPQAGRGLDDAAEHAVAEVRVGVAGARIRVERPAHGVADDVLGPDREGHAEGVRHLLGRGGAHGIEPLVAVPAGGVLQAVLDRDGVDALVEAGAPFQERPQLDHGEHPAVEPQRALLHELHHGGRDERLADAGDAEQRQRLRGLPALHVGVPEGARVDEAAVPGHRQRRAGRLLRAHEVGQHAVVRGEPRVGVARAGQRAGAGPGGRPGFAAGRRRGDAAGRQRQELPPTSADRTWPGGLGSHGRAVSRPSRPIARCRWHRSRSRGCT